MVIYLKDKNTGIGFEDEQIKGMAIRNLRGLAASDPETLEDKRESLTQSETIGIAFTSEEINKMIVENIQGFLQVDLEKVKNMVATLKRIGFKGEQIKEMAIRNLKGLAVSDPKTLEYKRKSLTRSEAIGIAFTSDEVNKMIVKNIEDFLQADLEKVKRVVAILRRIDLKDEQIKEMAIRNLRGLALSDLQALEDKRQSLTKSETIGIAFTSDEINKMIVKSIEAFLYVDLEKVKNMVVALKSIGLEERIKGMAIRNLQGLAGDTETLEDKRESLTRLETIGIVFTSDEIDKMIVENIHGFLLSDLEKVKKMVTYLKDKNTGIGLEDEQIKEMAIRDLNSFSVIKDYELKNIIEALKQESQLNKAKEETLMKKIREMIVTQNLIYFYYNFDANLKALICTEALSN